MKKSWHCPAFRVIFFCLLFWHHKRTLCKWIWRNVAAKGSQHRFAQVASYCWRSLTSYSLNGTSSLIYGDKGSERRKPPSSEFTCQGEDNQMACQSICISRRWGGAALTSLISSSSERIAIPLFHHHPWSEENEADGGDGVDLDNKLKDFFSVGKSFFFLHFENSK